MQCSSFQNNLTDPLEPIHPLKHPWKMRGSQCSGLHVLSRRATANWPKWTGRPSSAAAPAAPAPAAPASRAPAGRRVPAAGLWSSNNVATELQKKARRWTFADIVNANSGGGDQVLWCCTSAPAEKGALRRRPPCSATRASSPVPAADTEALLCAT